MKFIYKVLQATADCPLFPLESLWIMYYYKVMEEKSDISKLPILLSTVQFKCLIVNLSKEAQKAWDFQ